MSAKIRGSDPLNRFDNRWLISMGSLLKEHWLEGPHHYERKSPLKPLAILSMNLETW